jgi:hypothetical protein
MSFIDNKLSQLNLQLMQRVMRASVKMMQSIQPLTEHSKIRNYESK